jgi:hypothetical protein
MAAGKWLRRILLPLGLVCVAVLALLYFQQRNLLYFPQPLSAPIADQVFAIESQGLRLRGWVIHPGKPSALLYFGGNGEQVERNADFFRRLLPNVSVYLLPYRGYAGNPGLPTESALFADGLKAFDAVAARHFSVAVMGRSLGTGVAVYLAAHRPIRRLVLVTPYDSIENVAQGQYPLFPISLLLKDKFESWRRAAAVRAPCLVLIAGNDHVIPRSNTDVLVAHFPTRPLVVVIQGAGHDSISDDERYSEAIEKFVR